MLDYCGVYIGVSTRFSPLFNFDFSLAINRLGKQNAGKKFLPNFFFLKEGPIAALLKPPLNIVLKKACDAAFETAAIG